jgi:membrane protein
VAASSPRALGWGVTLGILVALWSAGAGVRALITALNIAYGETEKRGLITLYAIGFLLTLGLIGAAVLALIVIVAVPVVLQFLPLGSLSSAVIRVLTWLIMAAIVIAGLGVLYRYGPSRSHARLSWVTWGAIAAAILWLLASLVFQVYVANFANYSATYGSLGAVIALLMWFWISAFVVLLGAELNAEMEHQTRKDTTTGPAKPLGQRDAYVADHVGEVP